MSTPTGQIPPANRWQWIDTGQSRIVQSQLSLAADRLEECGQNAVTYIAGQPGLGKTMLVERTLNERYTQRGRQVVSVSLVSKPKPNELSTALLRALGVSSDSTGYAQRGEVVDKLRDIRSVVAIDEAHHFTMSPLRDCKHLIDNLPLTDWVFVGAPELAPTLATVPELLDRFAFRISMGLLARGELITVIRNAHPLLVDAPAELLASVDEAVGHGRLRPWRDFTLSAAQIASRLGEDTLTEQIIDLVLPTRGQTRAAQ